MKETFIWHWHLIRFWFWAIVFRLCPSQWPCFLSLPAPRPLFSAWSLNLALLKSRLGLPTCGIYSGFLTCWDYFLLCGSGSVFGDLFLFNKFEYSKSIFVCCIWVKLPPVSVTVKFNEIFNSVCFSCCFCCWRDHPTCFEFRAVHLRFLKWLST